jgi:2-C-methyl-D-erythritol 4-phosphate cytidylyltransferase
LRRRKRSTRKRRQKLLDKKRVRESSDKVTAVVPAAGLGRRFGDGANKQFLMLRGKPLLIWTLEALEALPEIYEIIPVLKDEDMESGIGMIEEYGISKVRRIAPGGKERQDSVFHGLKIVDDKKGVVLVHDAARPLIEPSIVATAIAHLKDCEGVVVGVPVKDTIKEIEDGQVKQTLRRDRLWSVQTPQVFRYETIYKAYERAAKESFSATDDSALVEKYGGRIRMVLGSYKNIKITTPEDFKMAELFLEMREIKA